MTLRKKLIGDRAFYKKLFSVMIPILLQNVITEFVSLLDNVMVGLVGTEPMSGVAIVNQLLFIYNICLFAGIAGAGIFTAQFYGKKDAEGVRNTFRAKIWIVAFIVTVAYAVLLTLGDTLISQFIHEGSEDIDLAATFGFARRYMNIMFIGMIPFAVSHIYAGSFRETGETVIPMKASICAVLTNLVLNYILIFGKFGAPALGVAGAAIATVISRFVELFILLAAMHLHPDRYPMYRGVYSTLLVPKELFRHVMLTSMPLLGNEILWSSGMTMLNQSYSMRGIEVVSAVNIASTVSNLFFCAFFAMGATVSIIVGQLLGAGEIERAVDEDRKLIFFSVALCTVVGTVMALLAPYIPRIYNTTDGVKALAGQMLIATAVVMPFHACSNSCYFTLRSGGKTLVTFIFDSAFLWVFSVSSAFCLTRFTSLAILPVYCVVQAMEVLKSMFGFMLVRKPRYWAHNLTETAG